MQMIEIGALENGAHNNQTYHGYLPDGWAVIPPDMEIPDTFPFVDMIVDETGSTPCVISMTAGSIPAPDDEPAPIPENEPSVEERVATLEYAMKSLTGV